MFKIPKLPSQLNKIQTLNTKVMGSASASARGTWVSKKATGSRIGRKSL